MATLEKLDLYKLHKNEYVTPKKPAFIQTGPRNTSLSAVRALLAANGFRPASERSTPWRSRLR